MPKTAIIIGAGPAGLTAAYELLHRTDIKPIILEKSGDIGGISKTIEYKGNRMDMGPHRFFSKSDRVMNWWLNLFPLDAPEDRDTVTVHYQNRSRTVDLGNSGEPVNGRDSDRVMLVIQRLTRIYFLRKFFTYPIQLSLDTLKTLGLMRTVKIISSYLYVRLFPREPVKSLEDYIINQFGGQLYLLFFKDYTEKVWGVPCDQISAEWGTQRIKGVSLNKAIDHAIKHLRKKKGDRDDIEQKEMETSLIEQFLYPKRGPGQLWEEVARQIREMGGQVYLNQEVQQIDQVGQAVNAVRTINSQTGQAATWEGDYFFSTMPVQELIRGMGSPVPNKVKEVAAGLQYRDFINVGLLLRQLSATRKDGGAEKLMLKDNWIYIQERDVKVGRLMIYNNWGTGMVKDPDTVWIGMEYFCNKSDTFWALSDETIRQTAIRELVKMGLARSEDVLDGTVARMEKTYPAYFGTYDRFDEIRGYLDEFNNLFLIGRNGMHKYNNADHSMLTGMVAVDNILAGVTSKTNLWAINTEQEYHEEKATKETVSPLDAGSNPASVLEPINLPSFPDFVFRKHGRLLGCCVAILLLEFIGFKLLYPFANFIFDSHIYIDSASRNLDINLWPVGYSKFLRIISSFTHSDTALVFIQFMLLEAAAFYLYFTLLYFLRPGKLSRRVMLGFLLVNPAYLSISNYVLSDALFTALSLAWFAQLFWLLYWPQVRILYFHAIVLSLLFMIRHNALYYPLITVAVIIYTRMSWLVKLVGLGLAFVLIGGYVQHDMKEYQQLSGTRQLSGFAGWQLASNAMFMYRNIDHSQDKPVPKRFTSLNALIVHELDSFNRMKVRPDSVLQLYYLWNEGSPLKRYQTAVWSKQPYASYFQQWAIMAPFYGEYGSYLIKTYPIAFARCYLLQNLKWFASPPTEMLGTYNLEKDTVGELERTWFEYKSKEVRYASKKILFIDTIYSFAGVAINLLFLLGLLGFFSFGGWKSSTEPFKKALWLVMGLWSINLAFSVLAAPVTLRYQLFMLFVSVSFGSMFVEYIYNLERYPVFEIPIPGYLKPVLGSA